MTFQEDRVEDFLKVFHEYKDRIRGVEGCNHLELLRDINQPNILMTYSFWEHPENLENYRHSELFKGVWKQTKALFVDKPQAWSVEQLEVLA